MAFYVDDARWERWHGSSGHLVGHDLDGLTAFAESLGLDGRHRMFGAIVPHYQLPAVLRDTAIAAGAVALGPGEFMKQVRDIQRAVQRNRTFEPPKPGGRKGRPQEKQRSLFAPERAGRDETATRG